MVNTSEKPEDAGTSSPTILVVEDNADLREVLQAQLKFNKFTPVCMENGILALEWLAQNRPALVVLDLMMPVMSGIEVCKHIREKYSPSQLPVLMLSALGDRAEDRVRGLAAGANDFLAKPYDLNELLARIRVLLSVKDEKERTVGTLARYLSPFVRAQLQENPDLLPQSTVLDAAVLFADIRGFTHLSMTIDLHSLTKILDDYFVAMMHSVNVEGGLVLDLTGDEILAMFHVADNLPNTCLVAVKTAIEMQKLFCELQTKWAEHGSAIGLGIGIHWGKIMLGEVGGDDLRRYTATGSTVNIAHRLVSLTQTREIIVSADVYQQLGTSASGFSFVSSAPLKLKGIDEPHVLYKLSVPDPSKQ